MLLTRYSIMEKLDINLIWFGLLLCANIQTSFMHPPFGFALFYLRGVAPKEVASRDIYLGSIPWIIMMIAWPGMVTYWLEKPIVANPAQIEQQLKNLTIPGLDAPGGGLPGLSIPGGGGGLPGFSPPPGLAPPGLAPPGLTPPKAP